MHRASTLPGSLDCLPYPSRIPFENHLSSYADAGWARLDSTSTIESYALNAGRQKELGLPKPFTSSTSHSLPHVLPAFSEAPVRNGLRTPPTDDMMGSTVYQPQYQNYASSRQDASYPAKVTFPTTLPTAKSYNTSSLHTQPPTSNLSAVQQSTSNSFYNRVQSPSEVKASRTGADEAMNRKNVILPNLQIPLSVNDSGGSLGEFAAQITCLFWFESTATLHKAESWSSNMSPIKRLVPDAIPTVSFRKWVVTILSTTQVTQNVILLALLFIYRLKTLNPTVKGKAGSEYRLLTVALMLGNKFLDDNTYTNKTWAEVSGISVGEIHVMEVEFLSNMRYSLLASKEQWEEWQIKLGKFAEYFDKASKVPMALPSPINLGHSSLLPSPPTSMQASPPALSTYSANSSAYNYNPQWSAPYTAAPLVSPLPSMPDLVPELTLHPTARKRSYDEGSDEPPAKRISRTAPQLSVNAPLPPPRQNAPRLPVPNLSISTAPSMGYPAFANSLPALPPLSGRAMATVFPTTPAWTPQPQVVLTPTGHSHPSSLQGINESAYGTPSRRQSPRSVQELMSMNSSPTSATFPGAMNHNSPSFFLQQRNSPYRPVRLPNTLLYPPPSASMHNFTTSIDQMHYQPLGKRNDYRSGVVPEYIPPQNYQNWPALPQPNFNL